MAAPPDSIFAVQTPTPFGLMALTAVTPTVDVKNGDLLVASGSTEDQPYSLALSGGSGLVWTQRQVINVVGFAWCSIWTAPVGSDQSFALTFTISTTGHWGGGSMRCFRNHGGVGVSGQNHVAGAAPSLSLAGVSADSAIVVVDADWTAADGAGRTWRTDDAGPLAERVYERNASLGTAYGGTHLDAGPAGTKVLGLAAPSQTFSIAAVEVLSAGAVEFPHAGERAVGSEAVMRAGRGVDRVA